ncbi:MAG: glycosyltransferase [Verrucomicrobia bacterium]|nr:glycosyltransferase [Verrucomicrobiota bacterium]
MGLNADQATAVQTVGSPVQMEALAVARPAIRGKFLFAGGAKFYVKGVTYGAFMPREDGEYHAPDTIENDFARMAANGINTVRIPHTVPPRSLLDAAHRHGLRVMVGLSAEQYVGYLIDRKKELRDIERLVLECVRRCADHPAVLCYALGNEIPASLVRYLGPKRVERYLERLYRAVKSELPGAIVTYANYPTTEYLQLPWLDVVCFNVYLESQPALAAYIAHLQNVAGERPLIMSELGLDSVRHGEDGQARALGWQIRTAFDGGCAGAVVFAWTDEWFRSGADTQGWCFGLMDRNRKPKPALAAVSGAFSRVPFSVPEGAWPPISVIVCTHNGSRTIRECLGGLQRLDYPDAEVIVVDDGSTDGTAAIARQFHARVIATEHRGLAAARNTGLAAATGRIVAYIDDDAWPDLHWLKYLALTFINENCAGVGGPNLRPPDDGVVADCVANSPGGPIQVMLTDTDAEHLPGCNVAFRTEALKAAGGFDPRFRTAGDDVDVCWQLQAAGLRLGFSPTAVVWHHAPGTISSYWKQQFGYGEAEALLEEKWPDKYNGAGHPTWTGRMYGKGAPRLLNCARIYGGSRGRAPFQFIYNHPGPARLGSLPTTPEWYFVSSVLGLLCALGIFWWPLRIVAPLFVLALSVSLVHAGLNAARASFRLTPGARGGILVRRLLTALLHLLQSVARVSGRTSADLCPWRKRRFRSFAPPFPRKYALMCADRNRTEAKVREFEEALHEELSPVRTGGPYAGWDLELRGGILGGQRILMATEDLGSGGQLVRVRSWPVFPLPAMALVCLLAALAAGAAWDHAWFAMALLVVSGLGITLRAVWESGTVGSLVERALKTEMPQAEKCHK